ncbi:transglycosylase domain-containing protein [Cohnella faecalis]|uniref:PBP1A family penicillin-binding protein n=2 Tax=Cohnella faecalis TaxID=2315694 RepID=A0A398CKC4_9BACL|nr:PBP1A family penicillin-binding protein [Cohnella faecalis]
MTLFGLLTAAGGGYVLLRYGALPAGSVPQPTQLLGADGTVIAQLEGGVNRRSVRLADISPWLIKATLAVEDRRFYEHRGVDVRGLARAAWTDVRHLSKRQGASTLTQQLARNLYLSHERTWKRKLKEAWYAARLEQTYTKDEILELYLNQIYYGHGAYGAEAASRLYFGKSAKELTPAESALLAGIPKGPSYYSPHRHPKESRQRRQTVLQVMKDTGVISSATADEASHTAVSVRPLPEEPEGTAPYFADYVLKIAESKLGIDERLLHDGGLVIRTTLDADMQRKAEEAIRDGLPPKSELQGALIAIDPRNGYIKAMVGGRSYRGNQYNRVFASTRQPGSSFKPIVYAAALERRIVTPATRFRSEPTIFYYDNDRKIYQPSNYADRYFRTEIGMRQAIAASDNIFAVNTIMQTGAESVIAMARRLGIGSPLKAVPSLALGTFPISPFEMASAFSAFANGGFKYTPLAVLSIRDSKGNTLYEAHPRGEQVISPALAFVTTQLLESVFQKGGTAYRVSRLLARPVAGKTGTTDSDAWTVGYTPELATAVWLGYDKGRAITSGEAHRAAPIFANFTESALSGSASPGLFTMPEGVVTALIDPVTGLLATDGCPNPVLETFLSGTEPSASCYVHGSAKEKTGGTASQKSGAWWKKLRHWWN